MQRGWSMVNQRCLSKQDQELEHFLIHYNSVSSHWSSVFSLFGMLWVLPCSVIKVLLAWHGKFVGNDHKLIWSLTPSCLFWTIWREHNRRTFEGVKRSILVVKDFFKSLFIWSRGEVKVTNLTILEFVNSLE